MIQVDNESLVGENDFTQMWKKQFNRVSMNSSVFRVKRLKARKPRCMWLAEMIKRVN